MKIRVYERTPGNWWLDIRAPGFRKRIPSGCATEAEANRKAPELVAKALTGQAPSNHPADATIPLPQANATVKRGPTLAEAFRLGMTHRDSWRRSKDKETLELTFKSLGLPDELPLATLTRDFVRNLVAGWLKEPGKRKGSTLSASTINHRLSMLSVLLKVADLPPHGVEHLSVKGNERTRRVLRHEIAAQQAWLLANAKRRGALTLHDMITVAVETGAREGELLDLQPGDLHGDTVTFRDTKNGRTRRVPLPPASRKILESRVGVEGGLFGDLTDSQLKALWNEAKAAQGLGDDEEFVFHLLRHEAASRMADAGIQPMVMAAILGHESLNTTKRYTHASEQAMREAQALVAQRQLLDRAETGPMQ